MGLLLLIATGPMASALGALRGTVVTGATDSASLAFWFQLAFMRLFGSALIGLGAILLWCYSHLTNAQHSSLVKVLGVVLGTLAFVTIGQQIAIWNSNAGWVLAGTLLLMASACAVCTVRDATAHAA